LDKDKHIEILERGVTAWNAWRVTNHAVVPMLSGADLSDADLTGADLSEEDSSISDLFGANLKSANLKMANLAGSDLSDSTMVGAELYKANLVGASLVKVDLANADLGAADLSGADLRGSNFLNANLEDSILAGADLRHAKLVGSNLTRSKITGTDFQFADLSSANVLAVDYLPHSAMRGYYHGIRGLRSCFGNAIFVRDAQDQDYLDTVEISIRQTESPPSKKIKQTAFKIWELIDFGRSLARPALFACIIAIFFGLIFMLDMQLGLGWIDFSGSAGSWLSPFYFSVVTFRTLGYGDILPVHWIGEVLVIIEVVLGYSTLGLLLSILVNKVARRS
jgi:hypothetical protein